MSGGRAPSGPAPVVHLVGAGLGDLGSLTRRAARLLGVADVVVLDRPSLDPVAALAPDGAERVHVGRRRGHRAWSTDDIVALLADRARAGLRVVRLKGGDPLLCSRGAEEGLALTAMDVVVDVTPGVTAASAAGAASGLARGGSVTVASGNHDPVGPEVHWEALGSHGQGAGALVVLTGRAHQGQVSDGLVAGGRPATGPAAIVHGAGLPHQEVRAIALGEVATVRLGPPAAMVVAPSPEGGLRAHT